MEPDADVDEPPELTIDERAAVRSYLQRSEARLSTVHRVATALLSGAGLMVLLPVVGRDAVVDVVRHLMTGRIDLAHGLLAVSVLAALTVPVVSLLLVLRDLTEFYFHANHVGSTFAPRFTLTGLRLPYDELGPAATAQLELERSRARAVDLLVADNDASRARVDERIAAYGGLGVEPAEVPTTGSPPTAGPPRSDAAPEGSPPQGSPGHGAVAANGSDDGPASPADLTRAEALFELAASRHRPLLDEVAKVEYGMARHVLRIQVIVLRYVKALLALLTTALAVFAAAAVVEGKDALGPADEAWLAGVLLVWAPVVVVAVATPVRWLEGLLRSEGATETAVGLDRALTHVEDVTVRIAIVGYLAAVAVMVVSLVEDGVSAASRGAGATITIASAVWLSLVVRSWARGEVRHKVLGGPRRSDGPQAPPAS